MRPWTVTLECIIMLVLWLLNAISDMICCLALLMMHDYGGIFMMVLLGTLHFLLNVWIIQYQWRNINKCGLLVLFLTQTAALYMIGRRAWRSMVTCCAIDDRAKKRKALIAKYSLCCKTWNSTQKLSTDFTSYTEASCVPSDFVQDLNSVSSTIPVSNGSDAEDSDSMLDHILSFDQCAEQQSDVVMGKTKFLEDTYDIELKFGAPQEIYVGEPRLIKFLVKTLQMLLIDEKKLSYHIITDSQNRILYVTKSDRHIRNLPRRVLNEDPPVICNDIHYALNLTRRSGFEVFAITKRTQKESDFFIETDLSKTIWCIVWPSAVIKLYTILDILQRTPNYFHVILLIFPVISLITWLFTQRGVSDPWKNTALLLPLRICITVPRTLLVIGIAVVNPLLAAFCYFTVKVAGIATLAGNIAYMKKYRNIELFHDDIEKYSFQPMYQPLVQGCESTIYMIWALWWYLVTPLTEYGKISMAHIPLITFLTALLGHVIGLVWLWFVRSHLKRPLMEPVSVLQYIQSLEYIKT